VHRRYNKSGIRKKFFRKYLFSLCDGNKNIGTSDEFRCIFALQPEIPPLAAISTGAFAAKWAKGTAGESETMRRCHASTGVHISCRLELEEIRREVAETGELPPFDGNCHLLLPD
jgi:hypothetical protein